jgi:primase-polymerase (primpol)-like protein
MGRLTEYFAKRATQQPTFLQPIAAAIPHELQRLPRWVGWRLEHCGGRWTKIPYDPKTESRKARAGDPTTWGTFEQAWNWTKIRGGSGVGFEFHDADDIMGIDLDGCRNPRTGTIEPWAAKIIRQLSSYTEVSPSGCGVHIILRGTLPGTRRRTGKVEMYQDGRYFCITGCHVAGTPKTIEDRSGELAVFYNDTFAHDVPARPTRNRARQSRSVPAARTRREENAQRLSMLIQALRAAEAADDQRLIPNLRKRIANTYDRIEGKGEGAILLKHLDGCGYREFDKGLRESAALEGTTISVSF